MSIEYTIDIQLTELGFPDILQPQETSVRETPSHSPTSLSSTHKQRLLSADGKEAGAAKQTSNIQQTIVFSAPPQSETSSCKSLTPAHSLQDEQAVKGTACLELSEPTVDDPIAGLVTTDGPQLKPEEDGEEEACDGVTAQDSSTDVQHDVEDDSEDSEVSDVYEEEEVEEEDDYEEEEGQNNESSHSGNYRCSVCDLQLPSKFKLQDHMNLHTGARPYCCAECGKRFCQIYNYRVHLRTHAQTKVDRLVCRICLVGFTSQEDLKDHLSKTHFEDEFYECDLCKRVFTSLKACEYHVKLHKCMLDVVCEICGRNFSSPKSLARHRRKTCRSSFKCTDCTQTFTKKNALLKHSFSHLGLLPYTCVRCHCHFRLAKLYRQHKCEPERIHCVACLREFVSQVDFQQHKKDTGCWGSQGSKGDEIRCLECGERFDSPEELKKHAGAHQRVLKCAECGKGFRSALLLMSHMGGHAGKSPCLCQICGLGFPHQQNYDSHLKTCGQTPQPVSAPKKRQTTKSSSDKKETKKLNEKPDSSHPANTDTMSAAAPAAPVEDPVTPDLVQEGVSTGPSDGLWKLTLDKQPPPGVKLVLFLPVCPTQTNGSGTPQTVPVSSMEVQPQASLSPVSSNGHLELGAPLDTPLDLVTRIKQDPECEAPLDLSKKCNSSTSALRDIPLCAIKNEPEDFEISGEANGEEFKGSDSKVIIKTNPGESEVKMGPMNLSTLSTSSELIMDIKTEPPSSGSDVDLWSSRSCQLTDWKSEKEIKMEVDISHPACTDKEK
ncbi:zinc finger protein 668-like isoform X1 [Seriola lalandi dorsalis]|uniref:zinc finger protein 668-like isoform X1 n=1 Tax=Seriola lalandi dorsalis TaxID=1841481 RepID=UPI000C6FA43D|nr:zinc finger protein 668-like isoform X1 [Seriola lalandi dorsalis]XP_023275566.1 zinc finger protein 668-like isoform X1 [Seriola lalandi dorsalis]XP_023275567.1 zinc finger protein 668-like isoform X1 [Seriola lalandi dorsalis]